MIQDIEIIYYIFNHKAWCLEGRGRIKKSLGMARKFWGPKLTSSYSLTGFRRKPGFLLLPKNAAGLRLCWGNIPFGFEWKGSGKGISSRKGGFSHRRIVFHTTLFPF